MLGAHAPIKQMVLP